jgi:peptidyl-prolyl cis-trans isomerase D
MIRTLQSAGPTLKIILGGMLLIICAGMIITLIPGGLGSSFGIGAPPRGVVARIDDQEVTVPEVQREARMMVRQQFPKGGEQAAMLLPLFAGQAAEQLISEKTLVAEARRMGLRVSDDELRDELQHGPLASMLFPEGKFVGQAEYENFVQRADLTVPQFENLEKEYILIRKLRALISGSAFVGEPEIRAEFDRRNTKIKFDYAVLTQADTLKGLHPTDQELKAFYDRNKVTYNNSVPEKRQIKYTIIETVKPAATPVTDQELQAYYDQHRDEYRLPEQVKVAHILIKTPLPGPDGKVDEKAVEAARKKAEDVLKQVKAGGDFAKIAGQNSDDPGSAKNGGELGWIGRGRTVPEFEKTAFSLPKGQTSDLVKSSYGFHIIRVEDKQEAHVKTLAEVKSEIEGKVKEEKSAHATEVAANSLLGQARTDGLDKAATAKGAHVVTTEFFSRQDRLPGLEATPELMETIFNEREKAPADVVQIPQQGYVIFELVATKPPSTPAFEDIRARVESEFKNERASFLLQQKTQELSDRAKAGHDLKKAAKELGATVKTSDLVLPDGQVPDVGSLSGAASSLFTLKPGDISAPINTGTNGVVAQLLEKQAPTDQDFSVKKDQIRQTLLDSKQNELFSLFVSNLRKEMEKSNKLKVNQEELKNLTRRGAEEGS